MESIKNQLKKALEFVKKHCKHPAVWISGSLIAVAIVSAFVIPLFIKDDDTPDENLPYYAESEAEIRANISESLKTPESEHQLVTNYISEWGVGGFDQTKFAYLESCFINIYNYENGIPEIETHAKNTVELYLENYYAEIDKNDITTVTDALLTCYVEALDDPYSVYRPPLETDDYNEDMSGKFGGIGVVIE